MSLSQLEKIPLAGWTDMLDEEGLKPSIPSVERRKPSSLMQEISIGKHAPRYSMRMVKDGGDPTEEIVVKTPKVAARIIAGCTEGAIQEHLWVICLNTDNVLLGVVHISSGTINQTIVDPGDVLTPVLLSRAPTFILAHNHPTGNPEPSKEDLATFKHIKTAATVMHRKLVDCIIVGDRERYYSWAEAAPYEVAKG